jgi:hypothetical protein
MKHVYVYKAGRRHHALVIAAGVNSEHCNPNFWSRTRKALLRLTIATNHAGNSTYTLRPGERRTLRELHPPPHLPDGST